MIMMRREREKSRQNKDLFVLGGRRDGIWIQRTQIGKAVGSRLLRRLFMS